MQTTPYNTTNPTTSHTPARAAEASAQAASDALDAGARRLTPLDAAMLGALALLIVAHLVAARLALGWITAALTDLLIGAYLLALLTRREWRPLLWRLLVLGLVAGILELVTDAAGEGFAHSLFYPANEPFLWDSPLYMPLSWMIVLTQLGYVAWRLRGLLPLPAALTLAGIIGALDIPFYEEMAYHAGWWHYAPTRLHLGHTPLYVLHFEGLIAAALPLLVWRLASRTARGVIARGVVLGAWLPCAALLSWLALGR